MNPEMEVLIQNIKRQDTRTADAYVESYSGLTKLWPEGWGFIQVIWELEYVANTAGIKVTDDLHMAILRRVIEQDSYTVEQADALKRWGFLSRSAV